jgi:hypothetical protein
MLAMSSEKSPGPLRKILGGVLTVVVAPMGVAVLLYHLGYTGGARSSPQESEPRAEGTAAGRDGAPSRPLEPGKASSAAESAAPSEGQPAPDKEPPSAEFSEVLLDKGFARYLQTNALLMATAGAKVIRLEDGRKVVLAVGSTALKDNSAVERLRAERVCRIHAEASLAAEKQGVQIARLERLEETTRVVLEEDKEKGRSVSELLQITTTQVAGLVRGMPVVGRWKSKAGDVFYLAIGAICDREGNPVSESPGK